MASHDAPPGVKMFVTYSGPGTGCGSGTAPGHIGSCVCPGDGCQTLVCALKPPQAKAMQITNTSLAVNLFIVLNEAKSNNKPPPAREAARGKGTDRGNDV
jgi:hypothetical protein